MEVLNIQQGIEVNIKLLSKIIQAIGEVRQFKQQCVELGNFAALLLVVLEAHSPADDASVVENNPAVQQQRRPSVFRDAIMLARLKATLNEIHVFVIKCMIDRENLVQRGWEIFVNRNLPQLKQKLFEWIALCTMETTSATRNDLHVKTDAQERKLETIQRTLEDVLNKTDDTVRRERENRRHLEEELERERQDRDGVVAVDIKFRDGDPHLQVTGNSGDSANLAGHLQDVGAVVCKEIKNAEMRSGLGSRHAEIYRCISNSALVQRFHGIAELSGKRYAVMDDLQGDLTVAASIESDEFVGLEPLTRLRFAYELANTVAYFHSVGIIVKNISDVNVVVRWLKEEQKAEPRLMNLEEARKFVEPTALVAYDVRFESPEYSQQSVHSKCSDVWSLGVLIWEFLTKTFPFSTRAEGADLHTTKRTIRAQLSAGARPWGDDDTKHDWDDVYKIVRACWDSNPALRPPASYVAQSLLSVFAHRSFANEPLQVIEVPQDVKDSTFEKIVAKRYRTSATLVNNDVALILHHSVTTYNDPLSSFLLGAAIWWDLIPADLLPSDRRLEYVSPGPPPDIRRARVALSYLELSVDAGLDAGLKEMVFAYHLLAKQAREAAQTQTV